jgi:uncharacterized protein (DUF433 family)
VQQDDAALGAAPPAVEALTEQEAEALLRRWIAPAPRRRDDPAEARIRDFGVPVWALIGHHLATGAGARQIADDYDLPLEAALAALRYYRSHAGAIHARLAENAA